MCHKCHFWSNIEHYNTYICFSEYITINPGIIYEKDFIILYNVYKTFNRIGSQMCILGVNIL